MHFERNTNIVFFSATAYALYPYSMSNRYTAKPDECPDFVFDCGNFEDAIAIGASSQDEAGDSLLCSGCEQRYMWKAIIAILFRNIEQNIQIAARLLL